jgi:hypothetical protein
MAAIRRLPKGPGRWLQTGLISSHRRWLESHRPQDRREIIIVHGDEVSCEDYKGMTAEVVMECFDSLMPDYRLLCNEYNLNACGVADLAQLGKTPEEILQIAGARDGQP